MPFVGDMLRTLKRMEADFAPTDRAGWRQKKLVSENVQRCSDFYQKVIILNSFLNMLLRPWPSMVGHSLGTERLG